MGENRRRRRPGGMLPPPLTGEGEDRISGLPDELLHIILLRLCSPRSAARTSVLSRSWPHVWAHPSSRLAPWLRFASQQRLVGALVVCVPMLIGSLHKPGVEGEENEIELPACEGAKTIKLRLDLQWRLRLCPAGIMDGTELTALVSMLCPRLRKLSIQVLLVAVSDVSIRSDTVESLWFHVENIGRLDFVTPRLEVLNASRAIEVHISAPKLAEVVWNNGTYDPRLHQFTDASRHLRLLDISCNSLVASLLQRFDTVGKLKLSVSISQRNSCPLSCPCRLAESYKIDDITLD
uniref:F-box domain-containing protein n=1 Tax=Setaria italica TaxID=4555 RepID=K3ZZB0_SETIT